MKKFVIIVIVTVVIIGIVVLLKNCNSKGTGATELTLTVTTEEKTKTRKTTTTEKVPDYIDVTVIDSEYICGNKKSSIKAIIDSANDDTIIKITDSNATYDTMSELLSVLIENNISYVLQK